MPIVDKCMECGFCERMCPSQGMTFTPRHRIVGWREISRLRAVGDEAGAAAMSASYDYQGLETCAACGLCAIACPVGIETGMLTKKLRGERQGPLARRIADLIADHYGTALAATRQGLRLADLTGRALGAERLESVSRTVRRLSGDRVPAWTRAMPTAASFRPSNGDGADPQAPAVVYLPSCASRTMGPARDDPEQRVAAGEDRGAAAQGRLPRRLSEGPERPVLRPAVREQGARRDRRRQGERGRRGAGRGERGRPAADRLRHQPVLVPSETGAARAAAAARHRRVHPRQADGPSALRQAAGGGRRCT